MRVELGDSWFHRSNSSAWGSRTVALVVTSALFAAAFAAMSTIDRQSITFTPSRAELSTIVYIAPRVTETPKPPARPATKSAPVVQPATGFQSSTVPASPTSAVTVPITAPPPRDSAATPTAPNRALLLPPTTRTPVYGARKFEYPAATPRGLGAPTDRAGVMAPLTPGADTALAANTYARAMAEIHAELARQNGPHAVGSSPGTVGGGVSIPVPLFSSGPSRAERRRNEALDADYRARLGRLQQMLIARRDSARADSLRRDSLARRVRP